jgi:hypothetical protein
MMDMLLTLDTGKENMSPESWNSQKHFFFLYPLLISFGIIIFWLLPDLVIITHGGEGGPGLWGLFSIIALPATIIFPLVYGWYSKNTTGAVLIGVLPFLLTMIVVRIWSGFENDNYLIRAVLWIGSLCVTGGLEGFFAAKKTPGFLLIALLLAGIWAGIFLSGIH